MDEVTARPSRRVLAAETVFGNIFDTGAVHLFAGCHIPGLACAGGFGAGGQVAGPVASGALDPSDGGVDVQAEQVGEDGGGQVRGEVDQRGAAGGAGLDAVGVQLADEPVDAEVPAGHLAREQPARRASAPAEHGRRRGGRVQFVDQIGQRGRDEHRALVEDQVGLTVTTAELRGFELDDAADGLTVKQDESPGDADP